MTSGPVDDADTTFTSYGAFLTGHRVAIATGLLVGLLAGLIFLATAPKTYSSTTEVLVLPLVDRPRATAPTRINLDTEAQLVRSMEVAAEAAERMGGAVRPHEVIRRTSVTVPVNTTVLSITFESSDPGEAQRGAEAIGAVYLADRQAAARAVLEAGLESLERQQQSIQERLQAVIGRLGTPAERVDDQSTRTSLLDQLRTLGVQRASVSATAPLGGEIVSDAITPGRPDSPRASHVLVSAVMCGLLLGGGLAAAKERLSPRLRDGADVSRCLGLPLLTVVDPGRSEDWTRVSNLLLKEVEREGTPVRSFLFVSTSSRVRTVAPAVAAAIGDAGRDVTLLEATSRVSSRADPRHLAVPDDERGMRPEMIGTSLGDAARKALERGDILLLGAPAQRTSNLAPLIADALVVVVDLESTRPKTLRRTLTHLHRDHHRLTGILGVRPRRVRRSRWTGVRLALASRPALPLAGRPRHAVGHGTLASREAS